MSEGSISNSGDLPHHPNINKNPQRCGPPAQLEQKNFSQPRSPFATNSTSPVINNRGLFYVSEDLVAEQKRLEALTKANPTKAAEMFKKCTRMVALSSVGDLNGILSLMAGTNRGAPPAWFAVKMFQIGVLSLNLEVPRFMVKNGFNCKMGPLSTLAFDLVSANGREKSQSSLTKKENMQRDRKYVETVLFLSVECGFDVTDMRKDDFYTLMHLAAAENLPLMVLCLLELGCDMNAVATDDSLPLNKAVDAGSDDCIKILKAKGARSTWRKDADAAGEAQKKTKRDEVPVKAAVKTHQRQLGRLAGKLTQLSLGDRIESGVGKELGREEAAAQITVESSCDGGGYTFSCGE